MLFQFGGPSQFETFDPKPTAPAEIRGEFKAIPTSVPMNDVAWRKDIDLCVGKRNEIETFTASKVPIHVA